MTLPTWNGQPIDPNDLPRIIQESFETLNAAMSGPSVHKLTKDELLHIVEAGSYLESLTEWARTTTIPAARAAGASWAKLGAAMGTSRSTAQYRYEKAAKEWSEVDEASGTPPPQHCGAGPRGSAGRPRVAPAGNASPQPAQVI
jgi:hypothetical protein